MKRMIFALLLSLPAFTSAGEKTVPVDEEPLHKIALKNDFVEVLRVTIPPGQSSAFHRHMRNRIAVFLSESTIKEEIPGRKSEQELTTQPGTVSAPASSKGSFTHRIRNVGKTPFEAIDIELFKRPEGPATAAISSPAAENSSFRGYRWTLAPGASTPEHTHVRPYLIVAATSVELLMKAPDGTSMEHPVKAGDFHWIETKVTHTLANQGKKSGVIVEIELH